MNNLNFLKQNIDNLSLINYTTNAQSLCSEQRMIEQKKNSLSVFI